jgi:hypothetical protein
MPWISARLKRQLTGTGSHNKFKAQMIDGSRMRVSDCKSILLQQAYLGVIDAELESINGIPVEDAKDESLHIFQRGECVATYEDKLRHNFTCNVYSHTLTFRRTGRLELMKLFTYINGGSMLSSLLVYR